MSTQTAQPSAAGAPDASEIRAFLDAAAAAPSRHDTRPWRLLWSGGALEVHGDPSRAFPESDPDHRELRIACGAALANARLAVRGRGRRAHVRLLPAPAEPWLLGRVRPGGPASATAPEATLARAIHHRPGDRGPRLGGPVPDRELAMLDQAARRERCWLVFLDLEQRRRLRAIIPDLGDETAVAVVCTVGDSPLAHLQAGQAAQLVLLTAAAHGLTASFVAPSIEVGPERREVRALLGGALWPQVALRRGCGPAGRRILPP